MQELEDLTTRLNRALGPSPRWPGIDSKDVFADWAPAVDVEETDAEYLIKADLPAMKKEDVKVSVEDGILAIEGERRQEKEEKGKKFHRIERSFGTFVRRMALPTDVDQQKFVADFKDGVLQVHLPKTPTAASRKMEVKVS
jgi:HSP20 family protein